jgi:hypothetical protein
MSEKNETKFYQVFKFGDFIGVASYSFSEVLMLNFASIVISLGIYALLAYLLPILMFFVYGLFVLLGNWEGMKVDRVRINIFSLIGYIYFLIDYHFGFVGWAVTFNYFGKEAVDQFCYINTGLAILNILLLFFGNFLWEIFQIGFMRLIQFMCLGYFSFKVFVPLSSVIIPHLITQHVAKPSDIFHNQEEVEEEYSEEDYDGILETEESMDE